MLLSLNLGALYFLALSELVECTLSSFDKGVCAFLLDLSKTFSDCVDITILFEVRIRWNKLNNVSKNHTLLKENILLILNSKNNTMRV